MYEPAAAQVNTDMRQAPAPGCLEKNEVARLRLTEIDMPARIILPVHLAGKEYAVLLVHIHDISGAIESLRRRPSVTVRRADIPLGGAHDPGALTLAANPSVLINTASGKIENRNKNDGIVQKSIFHFSLKSKVQSLLNKQNIP